ncbi:helix-turn-helix domain-containing protein [Flavobacteriaceae bacterium 3-367]|uniref:helix-turn-helix domain-containing protein n=1 Tax=Eudoraea algarum TaxID=3417568 RepID=UPI00328AAC08
MVFETYIPKNELGNILVNMVYHKGYAPEHSKERFLPDGTTNIVFDLQDDPKYIYDNKTLKKKQECTKVWFSGMHTQYLTISSGQHAEMMVVTFRAGGAHTLLKDSLYPFKDVVVPGGQVFGEPVFALRRELIQKLDIQEKFEALEQWLLRSCHFKSDLQKAMRPFVGEIDQSKGQIKLQEMAFNSGYSQKQFIHLFKQYVGLTPKHYHRIIRFNDILNAMYGKKKLEWASIALDCGYFDQAHFIKDFKAFSGLNPKKYIDEQGGWPHYVPIR